MNRFLSRGIGFFFMFLFFFQIVFSADGERKVLSCDEHLLEIIEGQLEQQLSELLAVDNNSIT